MALRDAHPGGAEHGGSLAHFLELPAKMQWEGWLYVAVRNEPPGLYIMFGTIGAVIEVAAMVAAIGLAYLTRERPLAFRPSLLGAGLLLVALICWAIFIAPANSVMSAWTPDTVPPDWTYWRDRWEYTHTVDFVLKLLGFGALLVSVLRETAPANLQVSAPGASRYATSRR